MSFWIIFFPNSMGPWSALKNRKSFVCVSEYHILFHCSEETRVQGWAESSPGGYTWRPAALYTTNCGVATAEIRPAYVFCFTPMLFWQCFGGQNQGADWIFQDFWTCLTSCDPASLQIGDLVPLQHCCTSPCWGCWCPWGRAAQSWHASSPLEQPPTPWQLDPIEGPWSMMVFQVDVDPRTFSVF